MTPLRVLVVDDHVLLREMLTERMAAETDMTVVGQAATTDEAVALSAELGPDIVLLDIELPGLSAFDAALAMRQATPGLRVIFLSAFIHDAYIKRALEVRAAGYLSKGSTPSQLVGAIRTVAAGGTAMCQAVLDRLVVDTGSDGDTREALLTPREREVVARVAEGLAQKQIARRMGVSIKTVQTHITHAMDKLAIHDRVELARYAIREGLTPPP